MATKIGDLFFEVSASTTSIDRSIANIGSAAKGAGSIIDEAISKSFIAAGIAAVTTLVGITTAIAAVGAEFNAAGQRATGLFTALTGSAAEAVDLMRQFSQISLDTPIFSGKALQDVTRTLLAYGVAKEDVVGLSVAVNSTATALGVGELGAHKLALALGQVKARGFFSAEEARQLANYGVNAYGLIADAVGKTTSEVRQLGAEHKLLSDDVLPILIDKLQTTYGPVAQSLVNTFGVQVQGLKNIFTGFASALVQPFIGRTGGGALVEFLAAIRENLKGVVTVGQDGTFKLGGALSGLNAITQALADGFLNLGYSIIDAFSSFSSGGGFSSFTQNIADAIPKLVEATKAFASGAISFFQDLIAAASPVYEPIKNLVLLLGDFVVNALPAAATAVVNFVDAVAPVAATLITITDLLVKFASPIIVGVISDLASAFGDLADVVKALGGPLVVIYGVLGSIALLATSSGGLGVLAVQGLALAFGQLAAQVALALGAIASYKAITAGGKGVFGNEGAQNDFLFGKPSNPVEGIFQKAAQFGRGLTAGTATVALEKDAYKQNQLLDAGIAAGKAFADTFKRSGDSMAVFAEKVHDSSLTLEEQNGALIAYRDILNDIQQKNLDAAKATDVFTGANAFEARVARDVAASVHTLTLATDDQIDVLKELQAASKAAWTELDKLMRPTAEATVDDFLRSLPKLAQDVTDALAEQQKHPGILSDLNLSGAKSAVQKQAQDVISTLAKTYGLGLEGIKTLLGKQGYLPVIEALGTITKETTKTVDPLIAKYGQLGATVDQLRGAVSRLNDQRQTAIKAQIDQISKALDDAKQAALDARQAIRDFFTGGQGSNTQKLIDTLIGNVGDIGSKVEAGLLQGGEQGAASIRLALGDIRGQLADIVSAGLQDGLSGQQIVNMLGPLGSVLQEQATSALNRISSLDWTEGFTPAAGAQIANLLSGLLDPGAIQDLLNKALGADQTVSGLQKQLDDLHAAAQLDVTFTPSQVQGALDAIAAENKVVEVTPVVTDEAAKVVYDAIQGILNDPTGQLSATIDKANLAQQVLDAAQEAAKTTHLIFSDATVGFNLAGLSDAGAAAATEFIQGFNDQQQLIQDQYAQSLGFTDSNALREALGPSVSNALLPNVPFIQQVTVNTPVTVNGAQTPIATGAEIVAAQATGAGSTGQLPRTLQQVYGIQVIPGAKGPQ